MRKRNDHVRINVPTAAATTDTGTGADAAAVGDGEQIDINQACPLAFGVKIKQSVAIGLRVTLTGDEMVAAGKVIGKLSPKRSKQIRFCREHGIQYAGKTEGDKDGSYRVKFEQVR